MDKSIFGFKKKENTPYICKICEKAALVEFGRTLVLIYFTFQAGLYNPHLICMERIKRIRWISNQIYLHNICYIIQYTSTSPHFIVLNFSFFWYMYIINIVERERERSRFLNGSRLNSQSMFMCCTRNQIHWDFT